MKIAMKTAAVGLAALALGSFSTRLSAVERATMVGRVAATQKAAFEVYLPLQHREELDKLLVEMHTPGTAVYQKWLTPAQFNARFAAPASQVEAIERQLATFGLATKVVSASHLHVTGSAKAIETALGTELQTGQFPGGRTKVVAAKPVVPTSAMVESQAMVTGLSKNVWMRTHAHAKALPENRYAFDGPYWFDDLKQAYSFPSYTSYTGKGATIGIVIDGDFLPSDMALYFGHEKLAVPSYTTVPVDGGKAYTGPNGDSFETQLDMQQSGGMAPNATILIYNMPDLSDDSILDALDKIVADNKTDVVSMSFGEPEIFYTPAFNGGTDFSYLAREEDALYAQGVAQGMTFVASSGDSGALSAVPLSCFNGVPNCGTAIASASFPATSPNVVGVGGTNLQTRGASGSLDSTYLAEEAYADPLTQDIFYGTSATGLYWGSGGGNSILFKKPAFQNLTATDEPVYRTVPDVSLHMGGCPGGAICRYGDSADLEYIGGSLYGVIGTSASAPDFAGLIALAVERFGGRMGNANYFLYSLASAQQNGVVSTPVFNTNIEGYNGLYQTSHGYNRVLGNGTVNGTAFLLAPTSPKAGVPQSPSNP